MIGPIPEGLPTPQLPGVGDMYGLLLPAFGVLLVGYTDNVLTARSFATKNAHTIDANQEFWRWALPMLVLACSRVSRSAAVPAARPSAQRQAVGRSCTRGLLWPAPSPCSCSPVRSSPNFRRSR